MIYDIENGFRVWLSDIKCMVNTVIWDILRLSVAIFDIAGLLSRESSFHFTILLSFIIIFVTLLPDHIYSYLCCPGDAGQHECYYNSCNCAQMP